jgi:hypothetical protein
MRRTLVRERIFAFPFDDDGFGGEYGAGLNPLKKARI